MAFPVTLNGRTYTLTDFSGTNYVEGFPDALEDFVTQAGDIYNSTSTTSNAIGTGAKTFTVAASKPYQAGTPLRIADAAAPATNFLDAIVTSYSGTSLVVDVFGFAGSGTYTSWTVNIGGAKTADGTLPVAQGGTGATTAADARTSLDTYSKGEADSRFLNVSGEASNVVMNGNVTIGDAGTDTLTVNATATLADATLTTADINGGTIDGVTIGGTSAGAVTTTSLVATTADINGGTIDGTVIGGSTPAAISGTTGSFSGNLTVDTNTLFVDAANNRVGVGTVSPDTALHVTAGDLIVGPTGANIGTQVLNVVSSIPPAQNRGYIATGAIFGGINGDLLVAPRTTAGASVRFITGTTPSERLRIAGNGDISFYEDTGTTPKFFWDASAERLGLGDTAPVAPLHVNGENSLGLTAWFGNNNSYVNNAGYHYTDARVGISGRDSDGTDNGAGIEYLVRNTANSNFSHGYTVFNRDGAYVFGLGGSGATQAVERMRINSAGSVGIGLTATAARLDVRSTSTSESTFRALNNGTNWAQVLVGFNGASSNYYDADTHFFRNGATQAERLRIDSSGNLLVGTTSSSNATEGIRLKDGNNVAVARDGAASLFLNRLTSDGEIARFQKDGTTVGSISVTATTTAYNTSSDYRLKEDVQPLVGASDRVLALNPVNFAWKVDGTRTDGFLAHEAQAVVPEAVTGEKDGDEMQAIDHSKLVPLLTAALQEALKEIADLKGRITALEA